MNLQDIQQQISDNQILQAVIKSLQTYPVVKDGDVVFLGKVNNFLKSQGNLLQFQLLEQLSDYIKLEYFAWDKEKIRVTKLGIAKLGLNPESQKLKNMNNDKLNKHIEDLVHAKSQDLSTWKKVQWQGGRVYVEICNIQYEIKNFKIETQILYIEKLLEENFIVQDNLPLTAPIVTQDFRRELQSLLNTLQILHLENESNVPLRNEIKFERRQSKKNISQMAENIQPSIFISYCWDSKEHEDHVISFADRLSIDGYHVEIDKIITQRHSSTNFIQMMEEAFFKSDKVIVVLSERYKEKAEKFEGGVGYEYRSILSEIDEKPTKYILVSFKGRNSKIIPKGFKGRDLVDLENGNFEPLYRKLNGQPEYVLSPVLKERPAFEQRIIRPFEDYQSGITKTDT